MGKFALEQPAGVCLRLYLAERHVCLETNCHFKGKDVCGLRRHQQWHDLYYEVRRRHFAECPLDISCATITPKPCAGPEIGDFSTPAYKKIYAITLDRPPTVYRPRRVYFLEKTLPITWNLLYLFFNVDVVGMSLLLIWKLSITTVVTHGGKQALLHPDTVCFVQSVIAILLLFTLNQGFTSIVMYSVKSCYSLEQKLIKLFLILFTTRFMHYISR